MESRYIHDEKVKVLEKISFSDARGSLFGQYKSYTKELGKKSRTETFSRISLSCDNKKYRGVRIFLRTGKMLARKYGRIIIKFKNPENKIIIDLQPTSEVEVKMHGKVIRNIDLCPDCVFRPNSPDAYEILIKDIIKGDRKLFVRRDEIHEAWRIVDSIISKKGKIPFVVYSDGKDPE